MATHIRLLSSEVVGQIAAGEVVERPSAAIKELVENSMDAGATSIAVEIRDGGLTSFRVVDNGSGIQPSDIRLAFARHATSKISQADDLVGVQTLGFRGEALASIAAVAKVTCTTPVLVRLTHREYEAFLENDEALRAAGFDAADFGDLTVQLRAVPMVLGVARTTECLRDALDDLSESGQISTQKRTDRIIQMACKHAVKGGEKIPVDAMMELVRRMLEDNVMPTCPHGRPLMIEVTQRELEKRFHRIQN